MSWQNVVLTWALRRWIKPKLMRKQDISAARGRNGQTRFRFKLAAGWRVRSETAKALHGEWIEPSSPDHAAMQRTILYLHGGGYVAMSPQTHRPITSRLAVWSVSRLFAPDYRLAPEHPFPAALEDAIAAYRALIVAGTSPDRLVLAGDSAGGGLALALLLALRDAGDALPAAAVLFSPWTDLAATGQSIVTNDGADPLFHGAAVGVVALYYLGDTPATHPLASPIYGDLTGLPPLLIQVSDTEVLLDDSRRVIENAKRDGVETTLQISPGLPHVWQLFARFLPEGRAALHEAAAFVRMSLP